MGAIPEVPPPCAVPLSLRTLIPSTYSVYQPSPSPEASLVTACPSRARAGTRLSAGDGLAYAAAVGVTDSARLKARSEVIHLDVSRLTREYGFAEEFRCPITGRDDGVRTTPRWHRAPRPFQALWIKRSNSGPRVSMPLPIWSTLERWLWPVNCSSRGHRPWRAAYASTSHAAWR